MKTELIIVGTELLLGQIINTNGAFLSKELADLGYEVYFETTVGDNQNRLLETIKLASSRSELVILCGGLGPTTDDLTKESLSKFIGENLVYDEVALEKITHLFSSTDKIMPENNKKQALTFADGVTIQNPTGLACGSLIKHRDTYYLTLPGPPRELEAMFRQEVIPLLIELSPSHLHLKSRYLRFINIGESQIVTDLAELIDHQSNPTIAPYAKSNEVMLRITAQAVTDVDAKVLLDKMEVSIMEKVGEFFYGYGEDLTIQEVAINELSRKNKTLSIIDLVTGGDIYLQGTHTSSAKDVLVGSIAVPNIKALEKVLATNLIAEAKEMDTLIGKLGNRSFGSDYCLVILGDLSKVEERLPEGIIYFSLISKDNIIKEERVIKRDLAYIKNGALKYGYNLIRNAVK